MEKELTHRTKYSFQWRPFLRQLFVSIITWNFLFMFGMSVGTPTVTIPQLRKEANSTSSVSDDMASWMTSIGGYVSMIWVIGLTLIAYRFGYKIVQMVLSVNLMAACLVLYLSKNAMHVLISQVLHGMTISSQTVTILVVSEYVSPTYRGLFFTIKAATFYWGVWVANAIGAYSDFRNIGLLGLIISIYNLISIFLIPESPYWLANKEKYDECMTSHRWLKGVDENMEKELDVLINVQKSFKRGQKSNMSIRDHLNLRVFIRNISEPEVYKAIACCLLLLVMFHFSGKLVITVYSIQIIKNITTDTATAYIGMLILDGFTVLGMYIGSGLSKILKRRTLLLPASSLGILFSFSMFVYLYLIKLALITENKYISLALLTGFSLAICCGPMILLLAIYSELIPIKSRNVSLCIIELFSRFLLANVLKLSPTIFKTFGYHGTFLFFAVASSICIVLVYKYLPETKDKTLHEIANYFKAEKPLAIVSTEMEPVLSNRNNTDR